MWLINGTMTGGNPSMQAGSPDFKYFYALEIEHFEEKENQIMVQTGNTI